MRKLTNQSEIQDACPDNDNETCNKCLSDNIINGGRILVKIG